jgi:hypothetical protein
LKAPAAFTCVFSSVRTFLTFLLHGSALHNRA